MAVLVTGGAGFIGSHTVVELQNAGYDVVVLDNLSNASEKSLERVEKITGKPVKFYKADILKREIIREARAALLALALLCLRLESTEQYNVPLGLGLALVTIRD